MTKTKNLYLALLAVLLSPMAANAELILSPDSVIANTLGELAANFADENLINQSGLSTGFTSGVTDFDTYLASSPTHASPSGGSNGGYASPSNSVTSGDIDFDLGGIFSIFRMVLWNDIDIQSIGSFSLFISNDSSFATSTNLGDFLPTTSLTNPVQAEVFDITDGMGQYVRLRVNSAQLPGINLLNFGELAFDALPVATVPEPGTLALLGIGLLGMGAARRRKKA